MIDFLMLYYYYICDPDKGSHNSYHHFYSLQNIAFFRLWNKNTVLLKIATSPALRINAVAHNNYR